MDRFHRIWYMKMLALAFVVLTGIQLVSAATVTDMTCPLMCQCRHVTRNNQKRLVVTCFIPDLSSVRLDSLSNFKEPFILELHCDSGVPYGITSDRFTSFTMLQELSMTNCKLTFIHRHAFAGLGHLTSIEIVSASNFHVSVHKQAFQGIPQLESFKMTGCGLLELPKMCSFSKLKAFNVSSNSLSSFKDTGLLCDDNSNLHLVLIDISHNRFVTLADFKQHGGAFPQLQTLVVSNNFISLAKQDTVLDHFRYLRILDLTHNNISYLPGDLLRTNHLIEDINLSDNLIYHIPEGFFSYSMYWLQLDLQRNALDDTVWMRLTNMKHLLYLTLSGNFIVNINEASLRDMAQLVHLDISYNRIVTIVVKVFQNLQALRYLNLAGNQVHTIENDALYGLLSLSSLQLEHNRIFSISVDLFSNVESLIHLNLSSNFIQELPKLSKLTSLLTFDASNNRLQNLPSDLFDGQGNVRDVNLSRNLISKIPEGLFIPCEALLNLDLSDNIIHTVHPSMFMGLKVRKLLLQKNRIESIGNTFINAIELQELNLSHNQIKDTIIRYMFPKALEMINLSNNFIQHVQPKAFYGLDKIRMIDLRHNKISTLEETALSVSTNEYAQTGFFIDENPLICDCKLLWLKKWTQSTRGPFIVNINKTKCSSVLDYPTAPVLSIPEELFLCYYENKCPLSCRCCGFSTGCDCKSTCPVQCECYSSEDFYSVHYVRCNERNITIVDKFLPRMATSMDLSGNNLGDIPSHSFIGLSNLTVLFLNNSNVQTIRNRSFVGLTALKALHLNHNYIKSLLVEMFTGLSAIQELFLDNNYITVIQNGVFDQMHSLKLLQLDHNYLQNMNDYLSHLVFTVPSLTLFSNPWACDCIMYFSAKRNPAAYLDVRYASKITTSFINCTVSHLEEQGQVVSISNYGKTCERESEKSTPVGLIRTRTGNTTVKVKYGDIKDDSMDAPVLKKQASKVWNFKLIIPAMVGATLLIILLVSVLCRKDVVKCWLFTKYRCKSRDHELLYDKSRYYDAFVSYHQRDDAFVLRELSPRLERGKNKYHLLVHHRDCPPRSSVTQFIENGVKSSHRTIIVLSNEFVLESPWLKFVLNCVKQDSIRRLVVITLGKIDKYNLDPVLRSYLQTDKHIHYGERWFWEKLLYCLPEPGKVERAIACAEAHPYASTDLARLATAVRDNQAYEEPTTTLKTLTSTSSRPLPTITRYIPTSFQSYDSSSDSQRSSNIYEEIKEQENFYTEATTVRYEEPWKNVIPVNLDSKIPKSILL